MLPGRQGISRKDAAAPTVAVIAAVVIVVIAAELAIVLATRRFKQIRKDS
jgi:predicted P-loop ATPase/GTPase